MPELSESYFLSGFLGSLRDEIRLMVRMFKPNTMAQAVEIANYKKEYWITRKDPNSLSNPTPPVTIPNPITKAIILIATTNLSNLIHTLPNPQHKAHLPK